MAIWVILLGCLIGSLLALLLGRYIIANYIRREIKRSKGEWSKRFEVIDSMFVSEGILLVAMLRLIFIPFGLTSYLLGITGLSIFDFLIGTLFYAVRIAFDVLIGCTIY